MRIGLISDTHLPLPQRPLPEAEIKRAFRGVDLILHAGDLNTIGILDWLETIAPVLAVYGNEDGRHMSDPRLKPVQRLVIEGMVLGMVHCLPYPASAAEIGSYLGGPVDIAVCGDTHLPLVANDDGIVVVNPGSPTLPGPNQRIDRPGNVGILTIAAGKVQAEIITLQVANAR